jgi:hypothetical protein
MAEINIQRKKTPVWPWILLLLLILLVIIFFVLNERRDDRNGDTVATDTLGYVTGDYDGRITPVQEFNNFAADTVRGIDRTGTAEQDRMTQGEQDTVRQAVNYTTRGFFLLSSALDDIIRRQGDRDEFREKQDSLRRRTEELAKDTAEVRERNKVRRTAITSVELMEAMQKSDYQDAQGEVREARKAAEAISAQPQEEQLRNFFKEANDVVQHFSERSAGMRGNDTLNNKDTINLNR